MPANAPLSPSVTACRSLSLPTQHMTKSCPSAAAFGVGTDLPPNFSTQAWALAGVRLNTVTSWPPFFTRCPAIGKTITPRPRKATLAMGATFGVSPALHAPDRVLEKVRRAGLVFETGSAADVERGTINPGPRRATPPFGGRPGFCAIGWGCED